MGKPGRRHYRVAQRETEEFAQHSCSCVDKHRIVAIICLVSVGAFVKGCLFGYLVSRHND